MSSEVSLPKILLRVSVTAVLLVSIIEGQCTRSTPPCQYTCHCADTSGCVSAINSMCNDNPPRCKIGWSGSKCQRENIALDSINTVVGLGILGSKSTKEDNQQATFYKSNAFDGLLRTQYESELEDNPYMWVNLKSTRIINRIKLITSDTNPDWISGFQIHVGADSSFIDSQMCYEDLQSSNEIEHDISCSTPVNGQYVRVQVPRTTILLLREMEIYECADYWFGADCTKACNCRTRYEVCNKVTGLCNSGCSTRFTEPDCQVCVDGWYGQSCTTPCGNCRYSGDVCGKVNGSCPNGCAVGYQGDTCQTVCVDGRYGQGCLSSCGNCGSSDDVCDKVTGNCPSGCAAGFQGDTCKTVARKTSTDVCPLPVGYIVAGVIIVILCVLLIITTVFFYLKSRRMTRKYLEQEQARYVSYKVNGGVADSQTPSTVYEEM